MKISLINLLACLVLIGNMAWGHSPIIGVFFSLIFVMSASVLIGRKFFKAKTNLEQIFFGSIFFITITIVILTSVYYFYMLTNWVVVVYLLLWSGIVFFWSKNNIEKKNFLVSKEFFLREFKRVGLKNFFWLAFYLILLWLAYCLARTGATLEAVRTPWILVSKLFFVYYFLATVLLIHLNRKLNLGWVLILDALHLFFSFSLANIIFPLGFGYDPFIHQATEKYIANYGFILPKNFYYLGQYVGVVFLSKILQISTIFVDKNLLPLLASVYLPSSFYWAYKNFSGQKKTSWSLFIFLMIPFSFLTFTTPQNLADLLVIVEMLYGFGLILKEKIDWADYGILFFLTLAISLIHPLAGMAAWIFLILFFLWTKKVKKNIFWLVTVMLSFLAVLAFLFFAKVSNLLEVKIAHNLNLFAYYKNIFRFIPDLYLNTNFIHIIKTIIYFLWQPLVTFAMILGLAVCGWWKLGGENKMNSGLQNVDYDLRNKNKSIYVMTFVVLLINSLLVFSFIDFSFLIDYEQGDFSQRIFNLGLWFLLPLAIYFLLGKLSVAGEVIDRYPPRFKGILFLGWICFLATGLTISLYFSYPRQDVYYLNRGFNTSADDFLTVDYLDKITGQPYVVLANQQVGAAALMEFGFRYFDNKYFFYSIPTGGPLYKIYAKIAYEENVSYVVVKEAMDLVGVNVAYVYLPDYWFNLKKIKPQLEAVADKVIKINNGKVWVFKFVRK